MSVPVPPRDAPTAGPPVPLGGAFGLDRLELSVVDAVVVEAGWSGRAADGWSAGIDGAPFKVETGRAGDHRFVHEGRSLHHLGADGALLRCAWLPGAPPVPERWRTTFDSVLFTAALLRGHEALHAGAVAVEGAAVAVTAGAGGGKSTLLAELMRRGLPLVTDDVTVLDGNAAAPLVHPGPPLMTVPVAAADGLGTPLADLGEERWLAVSVVAGPLPLAALVLLDRTGPSGTAPRVDRVTAPLAPLMHSLLRFPRTPERERARFEIASRLVRLPLLRLQADRHATPVRLADVLLAAIEEIALRDRDGSESVEEP